MNHTTRRRPVQAPPAPLDNTAMNASALQQGITMLVQARRELADTLNALCADLDRCHPEWDAQARATYERVKQEWLQSDRCMGETIDRMVHLYQSLSNPSTVRRH